MEVSNREEPDGNELIQTVVSLTGLPEEHAYDELNQILKYTGKTETNLTLDELRTAMLAYLEALQAGDLI